MERKFNIKLFIEKFYVKEKIKQKFALNCIRYLKFLMMEKLLMKTITKLKFE